jgi:cohesin complex subunit SCC1
VNPASLVLPDVLTELDLLAPLPDLGFLSSQPGDNFFGLGRADSSLLDFGSQMSSQMERGRRQSTPLRLEEDLGLDLDLGTDVITPGGERTLEVGRDAPIAMSVLGDRDETLKLYDGEDLGLDLGLDQSETITRDDDTILPDLELPQIDNDDFMMGGLNNDFDMPNARDDTEAPVDIEQAGRQRESQSPLSSIRSSVERDLERNMQQEEEEVDETVQQAQRVKRRKVLQLDSSIELSTREIRDQQNDHSKILKPVSFLPRDPILLALMEMQRNGGFVSNILGDGRSKGWAPELRGILSMEIVRQPSSLKRKRDAEARAEQERVATVSSPSVQPELDIAPLDEDLALPALDLGDETMNMPAEDEGLAPFHDDEPLAMPRDESEDAMDAGMAPLTDNFEDTTAPLLHPDESGPVSIGTKHAVHLLREQFGAEAAESAEERQKSSLLFQDLLPERTTSRADATKMFFEMLVLATKDAVKVEQSTDVLGGPLRVRAKRGLWGKWAEMEAGGEIAEQVEVPVEDVATAA